MKLKSLLIALASTGCALASSSSFANGLNIVNHTNVNTIFVSCDGSARAATFPYPVPWSLISAIFLGGKTSGVCSFYNAVSGGSYLGEGSINMASDKATASLSAVSTIPGYTAVLTSGSNPYHQGDMVGDVVITLTGNGPAFYS